MTDRDTRLIQPPPRRLWFVLDLIEEVALHAAESGAVNPEAIKDSVDQLPPVDAQPILDTIEIVAIGLDYVQQHLAAVAQKPSRRKRKLAITAPIEIPVNHEARRQALAHVIQTRVSEAESLDVGLRDTTDAPNVPLTSEDRWAMRQALGLVETAVATIGLGPSAASLGIAGRLELLPSSKIRDLHLASSALEVALGHILLTLST